MELVLKRDIGKLFDDAKKVKQNLKILKQDHAAWDRDREHKDLMTILESIKGLECDVSIMMSDCLSKVQAEPKNGIEGDLHQAFRGLNTLFEDLKRVRGELGGSYVRNSELARLEIDWSRFRKTIEQIQEDLRQG
jgi:hypothetical protein